MNKQWIVLWIKNQRMGSIELTEENIIELKNRFNMTLIQTDVTRTEHYEVNSMKGS